MSPAITEEAGETREEMRIALEEAKLGKFGLFVLGMQTSWRPVMAYETIFEFSALFVVFVHELWTGDIQTLNALLNFTSFFMWYFGMKMALMGVYSIGRTQEKVNEVAWSAPPPQWMDAIVKAIKGGLEKK
jgi:hypothetical protein